MHEVLTWPQALVLGLVQGLTEFLPISSSGHLRIVSQLWFGGDAGASFTAVTQLGTELAVLIYFARDIWRIGLAWLRGLTNPQARSVDYRVGWYVIIATIPISVFGFVFADSIRGAARNLWLVAANLILFALVIAAAEWYGSRHYGKRRRELAELSWRDGAVIGCAQALALVPGVSRSGATTSAGLFAGLSRETAVRFSFLLAIPAVTAAGIFSLKDAFAPAEEGLQASGAQLFAATAVAFVVGFASIAWLLRFVTNHSMYWFVGYRIALGTVVLGLLSFGVISA